MQLNQQEIAAERTDEKLSYRRGTARRAMTVEILSTAAQLYDNLI